MPDVKIIEQEGKVIEVTEHEDGRKSTTVHMNRLEINDSDDEATKKAKKAINDKIIPAVQKAMRTVVLVYKPNNQSTSFRAEMRHVRDNCLTAVQDFKKLQPNAKTSDFLVVEVPDNGAVIVSSLKEK